MFKRAKSLGALNVINDQFRDKIAAGYLKILEPSTIQKIMNGELFHQCISRGFVYNLSSSSTLLRLISNTSNYIPHSNKLTLVEADPCLAWLLSLLLDVSIRTYSIWPLAQGDLAKSYLSLGCEEQTSLMYTNYWYIIDEDNPNMDYPMLLASMAIDFGFSSASQLLSIAIKKYGRVVVVLQISKDTLDNSVYVDNINFDQCSSIKLLAEVIVDVKKNLARIGLNLCRQVVHTQGDI